MSTVQIFHFKWVKYLSLSQLLKLPVYIVFPVGRKIIIDNKWNLLDINTTSKQICCDKHTTRSCSECLHNKISFTLSHITMLKDQRMHYDISKYRNSDQPSFSLEVFAKQLLTQEKSNNNRALDITLLYPIASRNKQFTYF